MKKYFYSNLYVGEIDGEKVSVWLAWQQERSTSTYATQCACLIRKWKLSKPGKCRSNFWQNLKYNCFCEILLWCVIFCYCRFFAFCFILKFLSPRCLFTEPIPKCQCPVKSDAHVCWLLFIRSSQLLVVGCGYLFAWGYLYRINSACD